MKRKVQLTMFVLGALTTAVLSAADKATFDDQVLPIFRNKCLKCHNPDRMKADLDLSTFDAAIKGSGNGAVLASGDPNASKLLKVVTHEEKPTMPPDDKLADADIALIRQWIMGGLLQNSGSKAIAASKPKVNLAVNHNATARPDGPPPMPNEVFALDAYVRTTNTSVSTAMAHNPWSPLVAIGGQRQVLLYNTDTLRVAGIIPFPDGYPHSVRFSANGKLLIIGGGRGANKGISTVWDITTGQQVLTVGDDLDAVLATDISPNQRFIAHGGPDRLVRIFSTETGEIVHKIKKHTDWVTSVRFSVDGKHLATGDRSGGVHVWEAEPGLIVGSLMGHTDRITGLEWAATNVVVSASMDSTVRLWNTDNVSQISSWSAHGGGAMSLARTQAGQLVTSGRNNRATLWDPNGARVMDFVYPGDLPSQAAPSFDGKRVVGSDWNGNVYVWNAADGKDAGRIALNPLPQADQHVVALKVQQDKQTVVAAAQAVVKTAQDQITAAQAKIVALDAAAAVQLKAAADAKVNLDKLIAAKQKPAQDKVAATTKAVTDTQAAKTAADLALTAANAEVQTATQAHQAAVVAADAAAKLSAEAQNNAAKSAEEKQKLAADAVAKKLAADTAKANLDKLIAAKQKPAQEKAVADAKALTDSQTAKIEADKAIVAANAEVLAADVATKAAQKAMTDAQQAALTGKPPMQQQADAITKQMPDLQAKLAAANADFATAQQDAVAFELGKTFSQYFSLRNGFDEQKEKNDQMQAAAKAAQAALKAAQDALVAAGKVDVNAVKAQRQDAIKQAQAQQTGAEQLLATAVVEVAKANTAITVAAKTMTDAEAAHKVALTNVETAKAELAKVVAAAKLVRDKANVEKAAYDKLVGEKQVPIVAVLDAATKALAQAAAAKANVDKALTILNAEVNAATVAFQNADKAAVAAEAAVTAAKVAAEKSIVDLTANLAKSKVDLATKQQAANADKALLDKLINEKLKPAEGAFGAADKTFAQAPIDKANADKNQGVINAEVKNALTTFHAAEMAAQAAEIAAAGATVEAERVKLMADAVAKRQVADAAKTALDKLVAEKQKPTLAEVLRANQVSTVAPAARAATAQVLDVTKAEVAKATAAFLASQQAAAAAAQQVDIAQAALTKATGDWAAQQAGAANQRLTSNTAKVLLDKWVAGQQPSIAAAAAAAAATNEITAAKASGDKVLARVNLELAEAIKPFQAADQVAKTAEAAIPLAEASVTKMVATADAAKAATAKAQQDVANAKVAMTKMVDEKQTPAEAQVAAMKQAVAAAQLSHQNTEVDHAKNLAALTEAAKAEATAAQEKTTAAGKLALDLAALQKRLDEIKAAYDKLKTATKTASTK